MNNLEVPLAIPSGSIKKADPDTCTQAFLLIFLCVMAVCTHTNRMKMFRNCFQCSGLDVQKLTHTDRMDVTVSIFKKTQRLKRDKNYY